jgi:hypothetical protein
MFSGIVKQVREWHAVRKWGRTTIGRALQIHTHNETILRTLSADAKKRHALVFFARVFALPQAPNPFLAYRHELSLAAWAYADIQVLCLTPAECTDIFASSYISGELYRHIRSCANHNKEIERVIWQYPEATDEEVHATLNAEAVLCLYHLNGLNIVRGEFEPRDLEDPKDWFNPFIKSAMIFVEDCHRGNLHLPRLCPNDLLPLQHSTFMNIVENGHQQPLFE